MKTLLNLVVVGVMLPGVVAADDTHWQFTTGLDYSSGNYGAEQATDIWYLPFIARAERGRWQYKVTLPYVRMTAPSGGVIIGYDGNGNPIRSGNGIRVTEAGVGDVIAAVTYSALESPALMLDVTAKLKLGTASERKGLGTGKTDVGLVLDAYFPVGATTPFISLGWKRPGDPAEQDLRNTWQAGVGLAHKFSAVWSAGALYDWRTAAVHGSDQQRDMTLYAVYKPAKDWKVQGYASHGFSNASADVGLGLMVSRQF